MQTENDVKSAVKQLREKLKGDYCGGQPLLIIVGPSITEVQSVHVSIATLRYRVEGVLEGFDLFFKSFFALDIPYPRESSHILLTLQRAVYSIKTTSDALDSIQHSWINVYN